MLARWEEERPYQSSQIMRSRKFIQGLISIFRDTGNLKHILFRVIECKVTDENGKNEVNLIHSMDKGAVCIDKSRFDAKQTSWYPKFAFDYRSFRYKGDSDTKESGIISMIQMAPISIFLSTVYIDFVKVSYSFRSIQG